MPNLSWKRTEILKHQMISKFVFREILYCTISSNRLGNREPLWHLCVTLAVLWQQMDGQQKILSVALMKASPRFVPWWEYGDRPTYLEILKSDYLIPVWNQLFYTAAVDLNWYFSNNEKQSITVKICVDENLFLLRLLIVHFHIYWILLSFLQCMHKMIDSAL